MSISNKRKSSKCTLLVMKAHLSPTLLLPLSSKLLFVEWVKNILQTTISNKKWSQVSSYCMSSLYVVSPCLVVLLKMTHKSNYLHPLLKLLHLLLFLYWIPKWMHQCRTEDRRCSRAFAIFICYWLQGVSILKPFRNKHFISLTTSECFIIIMFWFYILFLNSITKILRSIPFLVSAIISINNLIFFLTAM